MNKPYHDREFAIKFVRHLKRLSRETFKVHIMHCSFAAMALRGLGSIFSEIKPISALIASLCKGQNKQNLKCKIVNIFFPISFNICSGKRSGSVVECLTRDRRAVGTSVTSVAVLCP